MTEPAEHHIEKAQLRRSPKYGVFLTVGAALGVIVALVLTFAFGGDDKSPFTGVIYSDSQVFGFLALFCATVGLVVGGIVALILDRTLSRRAREVAVDRERHVTPPED
ncbi:potassium transporter Trk [Microbacterium sp. W1N]|nr:potassium transporter Trk [Microbacterium festucae]MCT9819325.1 potassium transporter Trk [Microbacterium festucae]